MSEYLKCDAAGCDHIGNVDAITEDMIGTPCPKCSASLLTAEDYAFYASRFKPGIEAMIALGLVEKTTPGSSDAMRIGYHNGTLSVGLSTSADPEKA